MYRENNINNINNIHFFVLTYLNAFYSVIIVLARARPRRRGRRFLER